MNFRSLVVVVISLAFSTFSGAQPSEKTINYTVDITDKTCDLFQVTVYPGDIKIPNDLFNFPATAPGIYGNINFGRYVKNFKAFTKAGDEIPVEKVNTNQWEIQNPEDVFKIVYEIEDSYDSELDQPKIAAMVGTAFENEFVIFNTFGVLGYFEGMQKYPITLELKYDNNWTAGTSLAQVGEKKYSAENYDKLADSPILIGNLSKASTKVNEITVDLYVYSPVPSFSADSLIATTDTLLQSTCEYIGYSPVSNYTFLMCLLPDSIQLQQGQLEGGALEHNQSSLYFLPADARELTLIKDVMVHEFLHILTPLNAHSEFIHNFNFVSPEPSKHIWFYEGVTEWGSTIAQLRSGYKSLKQYLQKLTDYLRTNDAFKKDYSLCDMGLESYTDNGRKAFLNFYNRGAAVAALLDIRLLELSRGKKGLRELLLDFVKSYGQNKAFEDDEFFDIIINHTYPEIEDFIDDYICGTEPLPLADYLNKLGIEYIYEIPAESDKPSIGTNLGMNEKGEIIASGVTTGAAFGLMEGDVILGLFGEKLTMENIRQLISKKDEMKIGDPFTIKIKRDDEEMTLDGVLSRFMRRHVFNIMENPSPEQLALREVWMKNL
ncbi:MAG: hypothetical protein V1720_05570 [bacterium]